MFSVRNIRRNTDLSRVSDCTKVKKVKYFTDKAHRTRLEDKAIALMVLHVKCAGTYSSTTNRNATYNPNQNKKQKTPVVSKTANYHRYFLCADLANPPHCFCIITHSLSETCKLLAHIGDEPVPGLCFYMIEPNLSTSSIGNYLSVISYSGEDLMPIRTGINVMKRPSRVVMPSSNEETYYFKLENQSIGLSRARLCPLQTCTGYQCDRQREKSECTCVGGSPGVPMVYEYIVEFAVKRKYKTEVHASLFRSVRFTGLFFDNFEKFASSVTKEDEAALRQRRRKQFNNICEYVNYYCGWTIVGWCKKGLLTVENETEKVQSDDINMNLTYVQPTDMSIFDDETFQELLIFNDHNIPDSELTNVQGHVFSREGCPTSSSGSDSESGSGKVDEDDSGEEEQNDDNNDNEDDDVDVGSKDGDNDDDYDEKDRDIDGAESSGDNSDDNSTGEADEKPENRKRRRNPFVDDEAEEE